MKGKNGRDPKRIPIILKRLEKIWMLNPDLRLGQLILNVLADPTLYYTEDLSLIDALEHFYGIGMKKGKGKKGGKEKNEK